MRVRFERYETANRSVQTRSLLAFVFGGLGLVFFGFLSFLGILMTVMPDGEGGGLWAHRAGIFLGLFMGIIPMGISALVVSWGVRQRGRFRRLGELAAIARTSPMLTPAQIAHALRLSPTDAQGLVVEATALGLIEHGQPHGPPPDATTAPPGPNAHPNANANANADVLGLAATVASQGVTGLGFIQLDDDEDSPERLVPNDDDPPRIPLKPGTLDKLLKQSDAILTQAEQATTRLNQLLSDENQKAVSSAVNQLAEAAGSINRVARDLPPAVATFAETASSLNRIAKGLQPTVAGLPALSRDTTATMKALNAAADDVSGTARRLNEKGGPLDKLSQGGTALTAGIETFSAATLPKLGEVADEAARTMRQLRRTVNGVDDNPQALIFGNGPLVPGPGEDGFSATGVKK